MKTDFRQLMNEATRFTRAGDLQAATAAIQAAVGVGGIVPQALALRVANGVIEAVAREVPDVVPTGIDPTSTRREEPWGEDRFVTGHHANAAGGRDYKLYIPPSTGHRLLPLVVMLHGCTQDPDDFAAGTAMNDAARVRGCFVLYPAQSPRVNPKRCWNWFKPNHQQRGRGEPAVLAGMTREVAQRHAIDPQRVYVAGLSAGGAMAAILGQAYPELYAAVGVHSGLAVGVASDLPSALAAMKAGGAAPAPAGDGIPTIVFHGDADAVVHPSNAEQIIAAAARKATQVEIEYLENTCGRACTRRVHRTLDRRIVAEHWSIHGATHAWSGGTSHGSYTDARGPDATAEMLRFFLEHPMAPAPSE